MTRAMRNALAWQATGGVDAGLSIPTLVPVLAGGSMRRLADYTLGVVIVLVHLIMMSRANERLTLGERRW
jgi:hypothetical protein